jgi:type I restriction enzyme S subunit
MVLPEGWSIKPVGDLFEVQLGKMLNKAAKEQNPQYHYLGNTNVQWGYFDLSDLKTMHFTARDKEKFTLQPDDIVMCEGGEVGRCAIWQGSEQVVFYQKALHRLRSKGDVIPQFFQNYMEKIAGTKLLDDYTSRTSIAHLTREKLVSLPVKLPPLPEQKKMAQILSTWDKAITTTEQRLANSQQQKKALMQQLLTGKQRLLDQNGERFKGEWELRSLRDVSLCITKGTTPSTNGFEFKENGIPFVKVESIREDGSIDRAKLAFIDEECHQAFKRSQLRPGDVLFSIAGALGRVALVPASLVTANTNQAVCLIRLKQDYLDQSFAYFILQSPKIRREIAAETAQAAQPNLSLKNVGDFKISVPTMEEQQKIAAVLAAADQEITALQQQLDHLKQEKKALMQQLLTGRRRVQIN